MRIMNGDRVVARTKKVDGEILPVMVAEDDATFIDLPLPLFGFKKRQVTIAEFVEWTKCRCFPENRIGKEELLAELGLDRYNAWEIVKKTRGRLYGIDEFWIDFDN